MLKKIVCEAPIISLSEWNEDFLVFSDPSYSGLVAYSCNGRRLLSMLLDI